MGTFDAFADAPNQLRIEGSEITLKFARTGLSTGTVSWNIPPPTRGCAAKDQAYCGLLVILDNVGIVVPPKAPTDGKIFKADPTANRNLHAGDKIDTALVIGAFYEEEKKGTGQALTTSFDVTGLEPNIPYFVSGFAVDCQFRYHHQGVHAFSAAKGQPDKPDSNGFQLIGFNATPIEFDADLLETSGSGQFFAGILGTDATGLVFGTEYEFTFHKDKFFRDQKDPGTRITILGDNALIYNDLVDALNVQFARLNDALQSPLPPLTGTFYWTGTELFQWDGTVLVLVPIIIEPTDPQARTVGDYWFNTSTNDLFQWDGTNWVLQTFIKYHQDPTVLECDDYWFDGTDSWVWDGTTWCLLDTCNQTIDPSLAVLPDCADYWFDENTDILNKWNDNTISWDPVFAIFWDVDPNAPITGTYWFDETNQKLFIRNVPVAGWNEVPVAITDIEPPAPFANQRWFAPITEVLSVRNGANTTWVVTPVLVLPTDPTDRESCDLWWNSLTNQLRVWDLNTLSWDLISVFTISTIDPAAPPVLTTDKIWYNPSTMCMMHWDGNCFIKVTHIEFPTDPTIPAVGTEWHDTTNDLWFVWNGTAWDLFNPIDSDTDPNTIVAGDFWFDTTTNALFQWNGTMWVTILFTTINPTPKIGDQWFDTSNNVCNEWNGSAWVEKLSSCFAELDECGNLRLVSQTLGSKSSFIINELEPLTLFKTLEPDATITLPITGQDGLSGLPSYDTIKGGGTDGSPDERRELAQSIRAQLGWPVVEVELTKYQMDEAIQGGLEDFRLRSSLAYKRAFFFLDLESDKQSYLLTNERIGFNKIVNIMGVYRITSAFLTTAFGSGAFGQVVLQHLYNMGTFDLLSFDLVSQYIEQLEHLFASRITFHWDEPSRKLDIYQSIIQKERVLVEASIERSEQELFLDRWTKNWIERRAMVEARLMLAEIRGKYGSLPGAGGGVQLNAAELISRADQDMVILMDDIDNFVTQDIEDYGQGSTFLIG